MQNKLIYEEFKTLKNNSTREREFVVIPIPDMSHKLGVSIEGYPKFFIEATNSTSVANNTTLAILTIEYNLLCTFVAGDRTQEHYYTVVTLKSSEDILQVEFIDIIIMMLSRLSPVPTKKEIAIEVENLISIFSAMTCPPRKKIQGLWAELLVIEQSKDPEFLIKAWHESPASKYDFTLGRDKIEVKSTSGEERKHNFSLDQLNPTINSRLLIASTIVRESGQGNGGLSVKDLVDRICMTVKDVNCRIRIYKIITETVGSDLPRLQDLYFDYIGASDMLKYYDYKNIPGIEKEHVSTGISRVNFTSDLTGIIDIQSPTSTFNVEDSSLYKSLF